MKMPWLILVGLLALGACSSTPVAIEYYILNTASQPNSSAEKTCHQTQATVIESVALSSFLRQSGLVWQTENNKLTVSKTHLWAENLDDALPKVLAKDLQQLSGNCPYYLKGQDTIAGNYYGVRIRIDNFQADSSGQVFTSGRFQISDSTGKRAALLQDFHYSRDLDQDGYTQVVAQLAMLSRDIAAGILEATAGLENSAETP